jgi:hypothetical protein
MAGDRDNRGRGSRIRVENGAGIVRKKLEFLSYEYPEIVRVKIGEVTYQYRAPEFWCRKFIGAYRAGARFNALSWFRRVSRLESKEVVR